MRLSGSAAISSGSARPAEPSVAAANPFVRASGCVRERKTVPGSSRIAPLTSS
ncbi:Uncharacterised protein [Mycobacteroides abscessus subsp. abscessus]|nr:Uncharacterised protein [Mycobacteroides abscessus subsp. abscessus]